MPLAAEVRAATSVVGGGGQWAMGDGRCGLPPRFGRAFAVFPL
ncbi:polyphosphate kinase [Burkholderia pseudomallei]|nr:polyphosphate kinase [Burkholderia pseudomallei]